MPKLRDYIQSDISQAFFNADEFSDTVTIDSQEIVVQIDEERLKERGQSEYGGITTGMILYLVPVSALTQKPRVGNSQIFNGRLMYVDDVKEDTGVHEIILAQNRGE